MADFSFELPEITFDQSEEDEDIKVLEKEVIKDDLIGLFLSASLLTYILKSIFLKQKIVLIYEDTFLHNHIHKFLQYITHKSFEINVTTLTKEEYKKNKSQYKDSMVFEGNQIHRNINNLINPNTLKVERHIIKNFLLEPNLATNLIILKNEIHNAYILSNSISDFINNYQEEKSLTSKIIINHLIEKYNIHMNLIYFEFLMEIVKNFYKCDLSFYNRASDFVLLL